MTSLAEIPIESIIVEERFRKDMGELDELKESLKTKGQIQTLAVEEYAMEEGFDQVYELLGGGRRLAAMKELEWPTVMVRVYKDLTELERRAIELHENIMRKDFTWQEEKALVAETHRLMLEDRGEKHWRTNPEGWSTQETANLLGVSRAKVSRDIALAEAIEEIPQIAKAKDPHEAENLLARLEEKLINRELAKRAQDTIAKGDSRTQQMLDAYKIGDFFDLVADIPDESIDFIDLDPDYNIEFGGSINKSMSTAIQELKMQEYEEFDGGDYSLYLMCILEECHRVMKPNSWIVVWYAQHPWANDVYTAIEEIGFEVNRIPLVWNKADDNQGRASSAPDKYLGRQHETAYYARKGEPSISRRARGDVFTYSPPSNSERIHPCEKPVELMSDIITTFVTPNSNVLIPFTGSGNGLLAGFKNDMSPIGFDLGGEFRDGYVRRVMELEEVNGDD